MATTNVLFVCGDNAALSILAESILRSVSAGKFQPYSAGAEPAAALHPAVLEFLRARGLPMVGLRPKSWLELANHAGPRLDFVITLCEAAEGAAMPRWHGEPVLAHWNLDDEMARLQDPSKADDAICDAFWVLHRRIKIFASLPHGRAPRRQIQHRVEAIATWQ